MWLCWWNSAPLRMTKRAIIVLVLVIVVALPFLLRPKKPANAPADATLVIITPHNEAIRYEFGLAFQKWYRRQTGRNVFVDWRVIGGTSEIVAELTFRDPVDIGRLLNNEDFRKPTLKLKNGYVTNYKSRILRCTERFDEPKWFRL